MNKKIPSTFSVSVFDREKKTDTLDTARLRIFYKGLNRNGGYISDEFAETLIQTLPYTPVKGIYNEEKKDYEGHGGSRELGKIYGVVPENPNFAWEKRLDEDGIEREYAVTDVLIYSALYEEAKDIVGKQQSMELYPPSIRGDWETVNGLEVFKYKEATFLGFQILGDDKNPCFQGSAFFDLQEDKIADLFATLTDIFDKLNEFSTKEMEMEKEYNPLFELSDRQKENKLFEALNPEKVRYIPVEVYESYVIAFDLEEEKYLKVAYTKGENDTISVSEEMVTVFGMYVTEEEKNALAELRSKTQKETYEEITAEYEAKIETIANMQIEIDNKEEIISTLETDKTTFENENTELKEKVAEFEANMEAAQGTIAEFEAYKATIETAEKTEVLNKFSAKLSKEILDTYESKLSEFTKENLEKELAYELVKSDVSIFSKEEGQGFIPKPRPVSGIEALLTNYSKRTNGGL